MASGGNTWQKKLMNKQKRIILRERYGSMTPLADRIRKAKHANKRVLDILLDLDDETIKPPKAREWRDLKPGEKREGYVVRGFGKKISAREVRGFNLAK